MKKGAHFSNCRTYRYALWRTWDKAKGHVMFIGLNPSTADETKDDPTIRRCIEFAKYWGFGEIYMLNIFAFRTTNPKDLKKANNPIGPENDKFLRKYFDVLGFNVACWGLHGEYLNRGLEIIDMLGRENLQCFGLTKNGQPKHLLYLKYDTELTEMSLLGPRKAKRN